MRLCYRCKNYIIEGNIVKCNIGYWVLTDSQKTKTYNPIMFECLDYETDIESSGFSNDTFFDVVSIMVK